ncbi:GntR family transcriptional regulator [Arhodomonas sp. SL1]|uniref:GntR family transcriptional regulator n=1 Tax=Arhodomonas sp. SL1 TaxID=3425691 RepID=UPI003F883ACC
MLDNGTLSAQVEQYILRSIFNGNLKQGERVNETELASELKISRNPIREALRVLSQRGVIVTVPRRGAFVRELSRSYIDELFSFRRLVEGFAVELAVEVVTDENIKQLEEIVRAMESAADRGDEAALVENDFRFHVVICEFSGNEHAQRAVAQMRAEVQMAISMAKQRFETLHEAAADHWPIVEAMRSRDGQGAVEAIQYHIDDAWSRLTAELEMQAET